MRSILITMCARRRHSGKRFHAALTWTTALRTPSIRVRRRGCIYNATLRVAMGEAASTRCGQQGGDSRVQLRFGHSARVVDADDPLAINDRDRRRRADAVALMAGGADRRRQLCHPPVILIADTDDVLQFLVWRREFPAGNISEPHRWRDDRQSLIAVLVVQPFQDRAL